MFFILIKYLFFIIFSLFSINPQSYADTLNDFEITGNERISDQTIIMFSEVNKGKNINLDDLNLILKNIYNFNFFENVTVNFSNNILYVKVDEYPIIESITYEGIKAERIKNEIFKNLNLNQRSSYNVNFMNDDLKI